jgi:hypothetical protein
MTEALTLLDGLVQALQRTGIYNRNDQSPPAAVLWPDKERLWAPLLPALRGRLPVLTLGEYDPPAFSGPAYWIRCALAGTLPGLELPAEGTPILYLPGISRQEIRAVEDCPRALQPLAELQFRGVLWTQKNGKDWTLTAFLQSKDEGLGIDIASDTATREALQRSLERLAEEPLSALRKMAPLRAAFFDKLLNPDEVRRILLWLNDPLGYPKRLPPAEWTAFCSLCRQKYQFHPEQDGPLTAARLLASQTGAWQMVWDRFAEAPGTYPDLPDRLRAAGPLQPRLFDANGAWPQENDAAEGSLREAMIKAAELPPAAARQEVQTLEKQHAHRRDWVWARLGNAPLVSALGPLNELSLHTARLLDGTSVDEIAAAYQSWGWKADAAVLQALEQVEKVDDTAAVKGLILTMYRPWLEQAARSFQQAAQVHYPGPGDNHNALPGLSNGSCILFSDALRMDQGQHLANELSSTGLDCQIHYHLAAFPSLTSTAKPAVSPARSQFTGQGMPELSPGMNGGSAALTADRLRSTLQEMGFQFLPGEQGGNPAGLGWTECGMLDTFGHQHGWKMARHLRGELDSLKIRVFSLLDSGWRQVIVLTDHGWLLLPDGLPKAALPEHLTVIRKGRCARLKPLSNTDQQTLPWYWDIQVPVAAAPDIHCYEAGKEYEHGGLSVQECVTPVIIIQRPADTARPEVSIRSITWKGMRCHVQLDSGSNDLWVDLRSKAGDKTTSLASAHMPNTSGMVSLLVENEDLAGQAAFAVVTTSAGLICAQSHTTIGG